jgi:acetylornithine deacetylase/succinyl-diaminopimelate desuccinylase-like protein
VQNPALPLLERLQQAVCSLTDSEERPTFGGLLDDAPRPTAIDKAMLDAIPFDLPTFEEKLGAQVRNGLAPGEALYRLFFEPTCTICGLSVGYSGPGTKTAIPNHAVAKLDMRLPPGLVPDDVEHRLREHLQAHGFGDILVRRLGAVRPSRTPPEAAIVRATREAVRTVYGVDPVVHPLMTASGPMYELCEAHGVPAVTFGAGHASDNVHGIDENICLDDYFQAMRAMGEIVRRFGSVER